MLLEIFIGSQADRGFLREIKSKIPKIDILIDDGGHEIDQQIITVEELFGHISENGIYLCEDTLTSYCPEYGGGWRKSGAFMEYAKPLIDELNAFNDLKNPGRATEFTKATRAIHFYDGMVVIEKGHRKPALALNTGEGSIYTNHQTSPTDLEIFNLKLKILGEKIPSGFEPSIFYFDEAFLKSLLKKNTSAGTGQKTPTP